ncbi:MAG: LPS assembly lipoprotein LptE [Pseudomonadales bacterium]|nr:LPS assembly lipoprotein LptE [Pseudomonadales bacterium]
MRWILLLAVLSLDGCGFHLRGSGRSATQLDMLHVTAFNAYGELVQKLESVLTEAGVEIEPDKSVAPYSLRIISEKNTRRAATTTSRITVAEYELRLLVEFQLENRAGDLIIAPASLVTERVYTLDQANLMGSNEEEELLREEMQDEIIEQIIRRVEASTRSRNTPT